MIPPFDPATGNLPPGIHEATWQEFVARYGNTLHRRVLVEGLGQALRALRNAGCSIAYVDGSFITSKEAPGDFDGCWELEGVDPEQLDPVLLTFEDRRAAQKAKYGGELFPASAVADPQGLTYLEFFQRDRATRGPKGIIAIRLKEMP